MPFKIYASVANGALKLITENTVNYVDLIHEKTGGQPGHVFQTEVLLRISLVCSIKPA